MTLPWHWHGRVRYDRALATMERRRQRVLDGDLAAQAVMLLEHAPVITLGRGASMADVRAAPEELTAAGITVHRVRRGGHVTYHGPGQLMIYPVVRLRGGLMRYLDALSAAVVATLNTLGVSGAVWKRSPAGIWVGEYKVAACGLHVHRGVATHGFAVNLNTPSDRWHAIAPCGMDAHQLRSVAQLSTRPMASVARVSHVAGPHITKALENGNCVA